MSTNNEPAAPIIDDSETRNRGIELELKTEISRQLDLIANYNYIDLDEQLDGISTHQASIWGKCRYAIGNVNGLSAGASVRWLGDFQDGNAAPLMPHKIS